MTLNEQARDRYGRPLRGDLESAVPNIAERTDISTHEAWSQAIDFVMRDFPFHAHETFEQRWRCCPEAERTCWKALAQWAAALTQRARENPTGAKANAGKSLANLNAADLIPEPVDEEHVRGSLAELLR